MSEYRGNGLPMNSTALRSRYANDGIGVDTMSPGRQIVALYDRMILDLDRAVAAIERNDVAYSHECLVHAQAIVTELHDSLDVNRWPAAAALRDVYAFVRSELVAANVDKDITKVQACRGLLVPLRDAWREAAGIVASGTGGAA
jgi:flagellar secretion chaperone FliS